MRNVENEIHRLLMSTSPADVKDGLSNVLYWGYYRDNRRDSKVEYFRDKVTSEQLQNAVRLFQELNERKRVGLKDVAKLRMPGFSYISFVSKVRMFLDPQNFVVLDLKLMELQKAKQQTLFSKVTRYPTYIPTTLKNEEQYQKWCDLCVKAARTYFGSQEIIAVDVERGIFQLVENKQRDDAVGIVATLEMQFLLGDEVKRAVLDARSGGADG